MKRFVIVMLVFLLVFPGLIFAELPIRFSAPVLADGWETALGVEISKREEQLKLGEERNKQIVEEALPKVKEQEKIEAEQKPDIEIKEQIDKKIDAFNATSPDYKARCASKTFTLPTEQQAYDNCMAENKSRKEQAEKLNQEKSDILKKLEPSLRRWMQLDNEIDKLHQEWEGNSAKMTAIKTEIKRLNAIISVCRAAAEKCQKNTCSQQEELETWHLCESIPFDGADAKRFDPKKFGYIASVDPKLPPLNWKPENYKAVSNK
jgi:chromosome segregation ATPase